MSTFKTNDNVEIYYDIKGEGRPLLMLPGWTCSTKFWKKNVDELDIFGMSPYGDDSLIHIINTKLKVRVFIYNKDSNHETREWMRKLTCPYELLDSGLI